MTDTPQKKNDAVTAIEASIATSADRLQRAEESVDRTRETLSSLIAQRDAARREHVNLSRALAALTTVRTRKPRTATLAPVEQMQQHRAVGGA